MFVRLGYVIWFGLFNVIVRFLLWLFDFVVRIYKMIIFVLLFYLFFGISFGELFVNV